MVSPGLKATCTRDELAQKVAVTARAISLRSPVQILSGVLLKAEEGRLALAATDMDLSLRTWVGAEVEGEGSVVVPGRLLSDIARLLPEEEVSLEHRPEENLLSITCGTASYRLNTYGAEDFPRLPEFEASELLDVPRDAFLETVARVSRAASRDESRPVLTGILVRFEGETLVMAATDSYRLSVKETPLDVPAPALEAIVPARALAELARVAEGNSLRLGVHENQVVFATDGVWLTTRRIEGQFPDYKQLLPEEFEHQLTLPRDELLDVVRRTAVLAQRGTALRLRFEEGELTVSAQSAEMGEARESMPVAFSGEPLEIGFNAEFLRDGVESIEGGEVELRLISSLRPGLLRSPEGDFSYLIMPIRLAG